MSLLRSMLFTAILFCSVIPASIAIVLARLFGYRASYWVNSLWTRSIVWLCKVICGLDYAVEGRHNIPEYGQRSIYEAFIDLRNHRASRVVSTPNLGSEKGINVDAFCRVGIATVARHCD